MLPTIFSHPIRTWQSYQHSR